VTFKVADAQALPFEDNLFDAVITESVTAFPEDKAKAVREYARVTKPGGYVGLNESTWLKAPPPPEMVAWSEQEIGANVKPLTPDEWKGLLEAAGLGEIVVRLRPIQTSDEARGLVERYGRGGMLGVFWRMLRLYVSSPAYRQFVKRVGQGGIIPEHLDDYFGYGIYVGRK
jgi:SAM-dependent methyltransferase